MRIVNGWHPIRNQWDKFRVELRVSFLVLFQIDIDLHNHRHNFTLFNFRLELGD